MKYSLFTLLKMGYERVTVRMLCGCKEVYHEHDFLMTPRER